MLSLCLSFILKKLWMKWASMQMKTFYLRFTSLYFCLRRFISLLENSKGSCRSFFLRKPPSLLMVCTGLGPVSPSMWTMCSTQVGRLTNSPLNMIIQSPCGKYTQNQIQLPIFRKWYLRYGNR